MTDQSTDILQVLAIYNQRLAEFKRDMEALGVKVEVSASLGRYVSTVKAIEDDPKEDSETNWICARIRKDYAIRIHHGLMNLYRLKPGDEISIKIRIEKETKKDE